MSESLPYSSKNLIAWWRSPAIREQDASTIDEYMVARSVGGIALPRGAETVFKSRGFTPVWEDRLPEEMITIPDVRITALVCKEPAEWTVLNIMRRVVAETQRSVINDIRLLLAPHGSDHEIGDFFPEHTGMLYVTPEIPKIVGNPPKLWIPEELSRS